MALEQHLDAVTKARAAYVLARTTLENKLREQLKAELANLQTQVDIAVRYAHDAGATKSSILRSMGVKDFNTLTKSLERTEAGTEIVGVDPLDSVYSYNPETQELDVNYLNHGPDHIIGSARFTYREFDDGKKFFLSHEGLYNEDFTKRNDVVAVLDQKDYGFYYEEAIAWLATKKH